MSLPNLNPADTADVFLLALLLEELQDGTVGRIPDVEAAAEGHGHVVEAGPVDQVEVEVVEHVGCVKDLLCSLRNLPLQESFVELLRYQKGHNSNNCSGRSLKVKLSALSGNGRSTDHEGS